MKTKAERINNMFFNIDVNGFWEKREYDSQGNEIYFENSDGVIRDNRPKPSVVEIDGVKYKTN